MAPRSHASRAAADDLLVRDEVRRAAQVRRQLALREGAEAAAEVADVRVLDVPGDDVADLVAADLPAQPVGRREHALPLLAAGAEQADELLLPQLGGRVHRQRVARDDEGDGAGLARVPAVLAGEPERVGRPQRRRQHRRVDPRAGEEAGIDRQPGRELEAARACCCRQAVAVGPGRLGVDVVDRDRRDAAPVVDAGVEQARKVVVGEVRAAPARRRRPAAAGAPPRSSRDGRRGSARDATPCGYPAWRGSSARSPPAGGRAARAARAGLRAPRSAPPASRRSRSGSRS